MYMYQSFMPVRPYKLVNQKKIYVKLYTALHKAEKSTTLDKTLLFTSIQTNQTS